LEEGDRGGHGLKTDGSDKEARVTPFFRAFFFVEITIQSLPELNDNIVPECPV